MDPMNATLKSLPNERSMNSMNTTLQCLPNDEGGRSFTDPFRNCKFIPFTMSHMFMMIGVEGIISFFNVLPEDFKAWECKIERRRRMEEAPLKEDTILRRLRTKPYSQQLLPTSSDDHLTVSDQNSECCSICLGDYGDKEHVALLYYCRHYFHVECLKKWLLKKNTCPICRILAFIPEFYTDYWEEDIEEHQSLFISHTSRKR